MKKAIFSLLISLFISPAPGNGLPAAGRKSKATGYTDQLMIKFKKTGPAKAGPAMNAKLSSLAKKAGKKFSHKRTMDGDYQIIKLDSNLSRAEIAEMIKSLKADADIEEISPDRKAAPAFVPNDEFYCFQWHYKSSGDEVGGVNLPSAWEITPGGNVIVAVIDTGILPTHPDLTGTRFLTGYDMIVDVHTANDGDGREGNPSDPGDWEGGEDSSWHGTHVTGTIGANTHNGIGVAGVNGSARILPVRALGKGGGYESDIIDSISWAAGLSVSGVPANSYPAKVINMSLNGPGSCDSPLQNAIDAATAAGASVVAAAGNDETDPMGYWPANCNNTITVAATNRAGNLASYSNFGTAVTISAPGGEDGAEGVASTWNSGTTVPEDHTYGYMPGTSMAAPHVAGIISLMLSTQPALSTADRVYNAAYTARAFPGGSTCNTSICGAGIIDAYAALQNLQLSVTSVTPSSGSAIGDVSITDLAGKGFITGASVKLRKSGQTDINATSVSKTNLNKLTCVFPIGGAAAGIWDVIATNPDGTFNKLAGGFTVYSAYPSVTSITPSSAQNTGPVSITNLAGSYFLSGATVKLKKSGQSDITATSVVVVNPNKITCDLPITGAAGGNWDVVVTNGDGKSGTLVSGFSINSPQPALTSITPNKADNNGIVSITNLAGTYLMSGATVKLKRTGYSDITATNVTAVSPAQITCDFQLNGAAAGLWDVYLQNPDAQTATLAGAFTVENPSPTVSGITPAYGSDNETLNVTNLAGTGFLTGATAKITKTGQADISCINLTVVNSAKITCSLTLTGAAAGLWNVTVRNSDGKNATLSNGFTVTNANPTVTSLSKTEGINTAALPLTVYGTLFEAGASVKLFRTGYGDINASGVAVVSPNEITCTLPISGAVAGDWSLKVTNTDLGSGNYPGYFKIIAAPQAAEKAKVYQGVFDPSKSEKAYVTTSVSRAGKVKIKIYDQLGRYVATLFEGDRLPGSYSDAWDGKNQDKAGVSSGIYLIRIETPDYTSTKRVVLVK